MEKKMEAILQTIQRARVASYNAKHEDARTLFVTAITQLKEIYSNQKDEKKKALLRNQIQIYFKEAEENKKKLEKQSSQKQATKKIIKDTKEILPSQQIEKLKQQKIPFNKNPTISQDLKPIKKPQNQPPKKHLLNAASLDNRKKNIDPEIKQFILQTTNVTFEKIVGMKDIKKMLIEAIILPRKRPDIFCGIRAPPRGILFYGPPGNGKTYLAKALANESGCTFFTLSASSVMNKYVGDSQKMLRQIFKAAYQYSPSIIFIDQIDSILTARKEQENQASRRLKTEFLVQLQGSTTTENDKVIIIGATNLPNELDKAALRRFQKKVYIGMPDKQARKSIIKQIINQISAKISEKQFQQISLQLENYSASQIKEIATEVARIPLREKSDIQNINENNLRPVVKSDFFYVIKHTPPNLTKEQIQKYKRLGE